MYAVPKKPTLLRVRLKEKGLGWGGRGTVKKWRKIYHANINEKKDGVAILIFRQSRLQNKKKGDRASLVAQWLRIRLPMQGTRV